MILRAFADFGSAVLKDALPLLLLSFSSSLSGGLNLDRRTDDSEDSRRGGFLLDSKVVGGRMRGEGLSESSVDGIFM